MDLWVCLGGLFWLCLIDMGRPVFIVNRTILWARLYKLQKVNWALACMHAFVTLWFLTLDAIWAAVSNSCHNDFTSVMDIDLHQWEQTLPPKSLMSVCFTAEVNKNIRQYLTQYLFQNKKFIHAFPTTISKYSNNFYTTGIRGLIWQKISYNQKSTSLFKTNEKPHCTWKQLDSQRIAIIRVISY